MDIYVIVITELPSCFYILFKYLLFNVKFESNLTPGLKIMLYKDGMKLTSEIDIF